MANDAPKNTGQKKNMGPKKNAGPSTGVGVELEMSLLIIIFILALAPVAASFIFGVETVMQNAYVARFVLVLKIISGIVSAVAIAGIVYVIIQTAKLRPEIRTKTIPVQLQPVVGRDRPLYKEWVALKEKLSAASDADAALIIIDADALADKALKIFGARGETMGERIKFISGPDFKNTDNLWDAHKMRNQIAHGDGKNIVYSDALYAVNKFEKALEELEMI